ncbi:hypothetical protein Tco_1577140 [Tanacetum coccineum]
MAMIIQSGVKRMILAAQSEAFKQENTPAERLHGLDQQMERKEDESLYFMDRIWVLLVGGVRTMIMDEAHKTRYSVHPRADKMYHDLRASLETISAIEMLLGMERDCQHGIYTTGGVSRVDEMILARERSGFAGKKYGATYKL